MAAPAAFHSHRGVLKREGAALVRVASEASVFGAGQVSQGSGVSRAVRIVAIRAGDGALLKTMRVRALKLRRRRKMAAGTLLVDRRRLARQQGTRMHGVTTGAGNLTLRVRTLDVRGAPGLIAMTGQATGICLSSWQLPRIQDLGRVGGLHMRLAGPVTGLAGLALPLPLLSGLHHRVQVITERAENLVVTGLAGL
jgi:hypothetical protein